MNRFVSGWSVELFIAISLTFAALATLSAELTGAAESTDKPIVVSEAWARPTIGNSTTGAVYLKIRNTGSTSDRLLSIQTAVSKKAEIHATSNDGGIMRMRHVSGGVDIAAGDMFALKPAGHHVMLLGLTAPLKKDGTFSITLEFEKAGKIEVPVLVTMTGAAAGKQHHHKH